VLAESQDAVARRLDAVLVDADVGALTFGVGADVEDSGADAGSVGSVAEDVIDRDARKVARAELVDGDGSLRSARDGAGAEGLLVAGGDALAEITDGLGGTKVGFDEVGVDDGEDLSAGIKVIGEAGDAGVGVGGEGWVVLVVVLEGEGVFRGDVVVDVGGELIGFEAAGAGKEGVEGVGGA
jgi:hypothetical protein